MNNTKPDMFSKVIKSMIEDSGGSVDKIHLDKYMELMEECFMYNPRNFWLGVKIEKSPLDLMILQEVIFEKRPDTIIECGTGYGGSVYYMATLMDLMNLDGKIITVDHHEYQTQAYPKKEFIKIGGKIVAVNLDLFQEPTHPRIEHVYSDCLNADMPELRERESKTMVILDSDNSATYVYKELEKFSRMVTIGQYIIVTNTIIPEKSNGPAGAVKKFLYKNKSFIADKSREKFGISSNPGGYLLRIS